MFFSIACRSSTHISNCCNQGSKPLMPTTELHYDFLKFHCWEATKGNRPADKNLKYQKGRQIMSKAAHWICHPVSFLLVFSLFASNGENNSVNINSHKMPNN